MLLKTNKRLATRAWTVLCPIGLGVLVCVSPQVAIGQNFGDGTIVPQQVIPGQSFPGQPIPGQMIQGQVIEGQIIEGQIIQSPYVDAPYQDPNRYSAPPATRSQPPQFAPASEEATANAREAKIRRGDTWADVPSGLKRLFLNGGVPESLSILSLLEKQQQQVSRRASQCTVSVQIGPAQGCGVIITESGYVLTAAHVAMRPSKVAILTLADGRTVTARTLGMDRSVDAGLMKIDAGQNNGRPWPSATLGTSHDLKAGMWCIATGHPGGYDRDRGMVTRVGRILAVRKGSIVTDCALIGGDSGGPLFNMAGELIAVHSRIGNDVADNLHVPIDHYDDSWERMDAGESWGFLPGFRPVLGVKGNGTSDIAEILWMAPGSPAEEAGVEVGDIVERFGDVQIRGFESLKSAVADTMPGERVKVWLKRDDALLQVIVEIGRAGERN